VFGSDRRYYTLDKDMLDTELVSAYTDVYAVYDVYVYFFIFICQKVVRIKHMGCIWHGCNGQVLTALYFAIQFLNDGQAFTKRERMAKQVVYLNSIWKKEGSIYFDFG
jgi:hypothetical protein